MPFGSSFYPWCQNEANLSLPFFVDSLQNFYKISKFCFRFQQQLNKPKEEEKKDGENMLEEQKEDYPLVQYEQPDLDSFQDELWNPRETGVSGTSLMGTKLDLPQIKRGAAGTPGPRIVRPPTTPTPMSRGATPLPPENNNLLQVPSTPTPGSKPELSPEVCILFSTWNWIRQRNEKQNNEAFEQKTSFTIIVVLKVVSSILKNRKIVCLGFFIHSRFHSFGDATITGAGPQILTYTWHSWPLSREGSLACHTYCVTDQPFIIVLSEPEDLYHSHMLLSAWQFEYVL